MRTPHGTPARLLLACAALAPASLAQDASTPEEIAVTVARDGSATVREVRSAQLTAGRSSLRVLDVAPRLLPETVTMRALTQPELVRLDEQAAWFEILSVEKALESLAGRPVALMRFHESTVEKLEGRLLFPPVVGSPAGELKLPLYLEQANGQVRLLDDAEIVLDSLPTGNWNRMRLDWKVDCQRADRYRFELLYATRGLSWRADWNLRVAQDGATGDLSVVASITNGSGATFRRARLAVQEEGALHPLADEATLEREATLQLSLAQLRDVKLTTTPTFVVPRGEGAPVGLADAVVRRFDLAADAAARVGKPLPAGTQRAVVLDARGRPWTSAAWPAAATRGDALPPFFGEPLDGLRGVARRTKQGEARGETIVVTLASERAEPIDVDVAVPIAAHEKVVAGDATVTRISGHALIRVSVAARSAATVAFTVADS